VKQKLFIIGIWVIALGVIIIGYRLISPLFVDVMINEEMPEGAKKVEPVVFGEGKFLGVSGHSAFGTAKLFALGDEHYIRFEDDFKITNGPDLFVYLGKNGRYDSNANLGSLKGNIGAQNYVIPKELNPADYDSVWVWCRAFHVGFGVASLK